ncbi:MAG: ISAs1 family transposase, partial [Bacteroidota bacterium]
DLEDHRDNRGLEHHLGFVLTGVLIAILHGRKKVSSIHRFIKHRLDYLVELTGHDAQRAISDSQLRRVVRGVDWLKYNAINEQFFGVVIEQLCDDEWIAIDGKELRGSIDGKACGAKRGEVVINAVVHGSKEVVSQTFYRGDKESEKIHVRRLLQEGNLTIRSVSLDALHCDPQTTALIEQAGGRYLIPVKANQKKLIEELRLSTKFLPCWFVHQHLDKAHGRLELRKSRIFYVQGGDFDERWQRSGIRTLVVTERNFTELKTGKESQQTAYHISNQSLRSNDTRLMKALVKAVREHWSVEADNFVRDVTFEEDNIKTQKGNATRIWAAIRTTATLMMRLIAPPNIQAKMELWTDCPTKFYEDLKNIGFF